MLDTSVPQIFLQGILRPAEYAVLTEEVKRFGSTIIHASGLDVVSTRLIDTLERDWLATPGEVPRLALVFRFQAWAFLRDIGYGFAGRLRAHGTQLAMFYDEQFEDGHVYEWIRTGVMKHSIDRALDGLWSIEPMVAELVIRAARNLILGDPVDRLARMSKLASIARANGQPALAAETEAIAERNEPTWP